MNTNVRGTRATRSADLHFLDGGGEMGARIRAFDWAATPLGPPERWPQALRSALGICLPSSFPTAIYWGPELRLLYNDAWALIPAEKHPGALGQPARQVWADIWQVIGPQFRHVLETGEGFSTFDQMLPMQRGGRIEETYWNYSLTPIRGDDGSVVGIFNQGNETTSKVLAERARQAEVGRLRELFEQAPGGVALLRGSEHRFELANSAYLELVGPREVIGKPVAEALPEVVEQGFVALLDEVFRTGKPHVGHAASVRLQRVPGVAPEERIVDYVFQPIRDAGGAVTGVFVQVTDITERARAEAAQRASEAQLRLLTDHLPAFISYVDREGRYRFCNAAYQEWFGVPPSELIGKPVIDVVGAEVYAQRRPYFDAVQRGEVVRFEGLTMHAALGRRTTEVTYVPDRDAQGVVRGFYVMGHDVTERKVHEREREELLAAERRARTDAQATGRRFRDLVDSIDGIVWEADAQSFRFIFVSERAERLLGYPVSQWLNDPAFWGEHIHPDDRHWALEFCMRATAENRDHEFEYRMIAADGRVVWLKDVVTTLVENGRTTRLRGVMFDITERKRLETDLRETIEKLAEADRRKDEFLAVLAHELRNPLAPIRSAVQFMRLKGPADPLLQNARDIIERQVQHMVRLVDDLMEVSRITRGRIELQKERVSLDLVVANAVEAAQPQIRANGHELTVHLPAEPVYLEADSTRISQVLLNLLNNAAKYTAPGGHIGLSARVSGGSVAISVTDDGIGIAPGEIEHIFELFSQADHSRRQSQGGLGIGLSLARQLARLHGGEIEARSGGVGRGSEFVVHLPLSVQTPYRVHPAAPGPESLAARAPLRRILVVDDNADAADTLAMNLEFDGHTVLTVYDGAAALEALPRFRPDIVLLDIGMPGMDGYEVARAIRKVPEGSEALVVALTGWGQQEDKRRAAEAGFDEHLTKPVDPTLLATLIGMERAPAQ